MAPGRALRWKLAVAVVALAAASCSMTATTTTTTPTPTTTVTAQEWMRVRDDSAVFGGSGRQVVRSVVVGGPGLVAVGEDLDVSGGDGDADGAVWTSVDGLTWIRVPHDEGVFGGPDSQGMWSLVAGGPGLVAVGYEWSGGDQDGAVWTSVDGSTWTRVPHDESVFGGEEAQEMRSVVAGGPGLVAVGDDGEDAAVWTSVDGRAWTRVPPDASAFGGPSNQEMWSVAGGGPGLVAVGVDGAELIGGAWDAAVWTSVDGLTWVRVPDEDAVLGGPGVQVMYSVAARGSELVAAGGASGDDDLNGAVWISVDGLTWARVSDAQTGVGAPDDQEMFSVVVGGPGLVAVGYDDSVGGEWDAAVWVSVDGLVWTRVPDAFPPT